MTSVYRQIGIGCERLFRQILCDHLGLSSEAVRWSHSVPASNGRPRKLHLDGRIPLSDIPDTAASQRISAWMKKTGKDVGVTVPVVDSLLGAVFEIRQGYKSKDSKRQNADIANAAAAYAHAYLPCAIVLSMQIDRGVLFRYRKAMWSVLTGVVGLNDPMRSTYDFMSQIIGYDLAGFFQRNSNALREEIDTTLRILLASGAK